MVLAWATFPLIWIGGLVTSYDAGMAVPDWPNTYGYNLFLYPWQTWLEGPRNLFIEHGHRLFASMVGLLSIVFLVAAFRFSRRASVRWLAVAVLVGVLFQGLLGGLRVIEDQVQLARIHGCIGPAFFALTVAAATITSRTWRNPPLRARAPLLKVERLALITTVLAYCQLVLGSQLRHVTTDTGPGEFRLAVMFHLAMALAVLVHAVLLARQVYRSERDEPTLLRPATALVVQVTCEIMLGLSTWVTKYGWPAWLEGYGFAADYRVVADSPRQAWIATAHVALGSLILATSVLLSLRSARYASQGRQPAASGGPLLMEAAR